MIHLFCCLLFSIAAWADTYSNDIPPRLQWVNNSGYCGEVSLISAGLYYGQYVSQFTARDLVARRGDQVDGELLIGVNDTRAAKKMHLEYEEWDADSQETTDEFLSWVKQKVVKGYPVAIGVYANQYLFYEDTDPDAGDPDYDHIVSVTTIHSPHAHSDQLGFSDHGLWDDGTTPIYHFNYSFDSFQSDRRDANGKNGPIYSIDNSGANYGIAITGIKDLNKDTLPVRVDTNFNYEKPEIIDGSNTRPKPMPIDLTITVSNLEPGVSYILYRYNRLESVPESNFNANQNLSFEKWPFQISSGSTYTQVEKIQSDEVAVYRAVKVTAP